MLSVLNFYAFHIVSNYVSTRIPKTLFQLLCAGRSVSGATWQRLCLSSPCVSVVLRGCRNVGSVTAIS